MSAEESWSTCSESLAQLVLMDPNLKEAEPIEAPHPPFVHGTISCVLYLEDHFLIWTQYG